MTKTLAGDPARRCKPVREWPELDRQLWLAALQPGDIVDPGGERARFAEHSNRKIAAGYGRWLQWLDQRGELEVDAPPANRITRPRVAAYLRDLCACNGTQTRISRLNELHDTAMIMGPRQDWSWLRRTAAKIRAQHRPVRPKAPRLVGADELYDLGTRLMTAAAESGSPLQQALRYRDGVSIAFLAARPLRRRNLAALQIARSLVRDETGWRIEIPGNETKTGAPISMPMPESLTAALDEYVRVFRPILAGARGRWWQEPGNALWLSSHGSPMTQMALYDRIVKLTRAAFGRPINPHLFRDCAATSIAADDPEHVGIAAQLLGHRNVATTERVYIQARSRQAALRWQQHVLALRRGSVSEGVHDGEGG